MLDRRTRTFTDAVAGLRDGATILVGGFGGSGVPQGLCAAVLDSGVRELTIVSNGAGTGDLDVAALLAAGRVRKLICSYPRSQSSTIFAELYAAGKVELELLPQGTLVERMRCAGAGLGGVYTPTGAGTALAQGKETRVMDGKEYVLELPLKGDFALLKAHKADRLGNLVYRLLARNFSPVMATAATVVVAEVDQIVDVGALDPENIVTPGIFVDRIVLRGAPQ